MIRKLMRHSEKLLSNSPLKTASNENCKNKDCSSWAELQVVLNDHINNEEYIRAYELLTSNNVDLEEIHLGRSVRKIVTRTGEEQRRILCGKVRQDFLSLPRDQWSSSKNRIINFGYFFILLEEWEEAYKLLVPHQNTFNTLPQKDLWSTAAFEYIRLLIDEGRASEADIVISHAITTHDFAQRNQKRLWQIFTLAIERTYVSVSNTVRNPLLSCEAFLAFTENLGKRVNDQLSLPAVVEKWFEYTPFARTAGEKRSMPVNRPLRILITYVNSNFLRLPCLELEKAGFEIRHLPFDRIIEALKPRSGEVDVPSLNEMIYGIGPFYISQKNAMQALEERAPWACELIEWCDIVFAEWWNHPAIWFSRYLHQEKALVVRLHSYEAFTSMPRFTNMNGVDGAIFIADHIQKIFYKTCEGASKYSHRDTVIQNIRDLKHGSPSRRNETERNTLCLLGYSKRNKDPLLALDILESLIKDDPAWRLKLIGDPWPDKLRESDKDYFTRFQDKMTCLNEHITVVPFTYEALEELKKIGFILSTSLREGSHEAVVEGMSVGCIPVVRSWPQVQRFGGPQNIFSDVTIFDTTDQAVNAIKQHRRNFNEESKRARENALSRFDRKRSGPMFVDFIKKSYMRANLPE